MLTISKPLSAGQARSYHAEEFANAKDNYYTQGEHVVGEWHGRLAEEWGLKGEVREQQFHRLSEGQHPVTGEQLVRHQSPREYVNEDGEKVKTIEHRAGWDATFSAPKSVSLTVLVGGDERVRDAHRESVSVALGEMERFVQARLGSNLPAETTGKWVAAKFEHDSSRPVDGYAAPQLHTHVVFFNVTQTANGDSRALQPRELYKSQQYGTAIYRSELAARLKEIGYEIERGKSGQPEIKGYSAEYLEASSPRRRQIEEHLAKTNQRGAGAAQIAAHQTRGRKLETSHEEMQERHRVLATKFGGQPEHIVESARRRGNQHKPEPNERMVRQALTYSTERSMEREAVADERSLLRDALSRSMGQATFAEVKSGLDKKAQVGELTELREHSNSPSRAFTTKEMQSYERETIQRMREGQHQFPEIASQRSRDSIERNYSHLNETQRRAVTQILSSRDLVMALEGVAGSGKTTSLAAIREVAERHGYKVEGFAPTSRAAQKLSESGIESRTLQRHLSSTEESQNNGKRFYVLDESSLASTKQMNEFLHRLSGEDRVLLVGDTSQHQAVEAGRPYQQLREAGIETARLDEIVRQKELALKEAVEQLSRGSVKEAIDNLRSQGRVHEIGDRNERMLKIADEYARQPTGTLVVSPDNQSRREINDVIHRRMQEAGTVARQEHKLNVLVPRQEITGADRRWSGQYDPGDVVRYTKGSRAHGIKPGEYARVEQSNEKENLLTVRRGNGERVSYDPRRLHGVTIYRESDRAFSEGDRVQFTAPNKELGVANRELGTIERINGDGDIRLRLDSGRVTQFNVNKNPHLDYGYAVTSHSSQGQTADRVLIHIDTNQAGEKLVNRRLAYVAVSRGRYDAQIYTNDALDLREALSRDTSKTVALEIDGQLNHGGKDQFVVRQSINQNTPPRVAGGQSEANRQGSGQQAGGDGQSGQRS
jgi:conjugative relaxase-like TrwC/TraI family protein